MDLARSLCVYTFPAVLPLRSPLEFLVAFLASGGLPCHIILCWLVNKYLSLSLGYECLKKKSKKVIHSLAATW